MPVLPVILNTYLVTQHTDSTFERHEFANVLGIHDISGAATLSQIATKVAAQWAAHIMPFASAATSMGTTDVLPLDGASSTQSFATASFGTAGGHGTGNSLTNAVQMVLAWQTGHRGKSKRGRSYIVGVTDDMAVHPLANTVLPGQITAMNTGGNAFLAGLTAGAAPSLELVVVSRKLGTSQVVTNCRGDSQFGIQRRRYEKVARH